METQTSSASSEGELDPMMAALARDRTNFKAAVDAARLYRLFWVKFKIIDGCNIRCVMCNHWRRTDYRRSALSRERLMGLADELAALRARHVNWSGGEPTLRKDLPEIIGRLSDLGIGSSIITNGTLLTPKYADRLLKGRLAFVGYSLESGVPELHDRVVGIKGAWDKLVASARYFQAANGAGPALVVNAVLTSINTGPGLIDLVQLAYEIGVRKVNLSCVYTNHLAVDERATLPPSPDQVARFRNEWLPAMRELAVKLGVQIIANGSDEAPPVSQQNLGKFEHIMGYYQHPDRSCYLPFYHCTIDYNGNVVGCCHMREGPGMIGNIRNTPLHEVLDSEAARSLRRRLTTADMPSACGHCAMQIAENQQIDRILAGCAD